MLRKFIVTLLLITFSGGMAFANWIEFGETDSGVHYIDLNETGSDDKYVYYWVLTNYFNPQENSSLSLKNIRQKKYTNRQIVKDLGLVLYK